MNDGSDRRLAFLDGLRAVATIAVLLQHYLEVVAHEVSLPFLQFAPGLFGVVLFFCISGYVIPFSIKGTLHPTVFAMHRLLRIMPLYVCVVTALLLLSALGVTPFASRFEAITAPEVFANYLLFFEYVDAPPVLGVAWTLSVEFGWYVLFAVYFWCFGHRKVIAASVMYSVCMIGLAVLSLLLDTRVPIGRIGMIGAAIMGYVICCWHLRCISWRAAFFAIGVFAAATLFCQWVSFGYFGHPNMTLFNVLSAWLMAIALFGFIAALKRMRQARIWRHPFVMVWARLSFGIYLLHMPVFMLLKNVFVGGVLMLVAVVGTLVLSEIAYRFIEMPGIRLGKRHFWRKSVASGVR